MFNTSIKVHITVLISANSVLLLLLLNDKVKQHSLVERGKNAEEVKRKCSTEEKSVYVVAMLVDMK